MVCERCRFNPRAHSFKHFGSVGDVLLWYTAPADGQEVFDSNEKFLLFKADMDDALGKKWIWVFDCARMTSGHYSSIQFMRSLVKTLSNEHAEWLQKIYIINPDLWIRAAIAIMKPFMNSSVLNKIVFFETANIEFFAALKGARLSYRPWMQN
jgi:CRAL/TRIO domain